MATYIIYDILYCVYVLQFVTKSFDAGNFYRQIFISVICICFMKYGGTLNLILASVLRGGAVGPPLIYV